MNMLGVLIGVGSVVMLTGIGTGLQSYISDQFAALGTNTLYVVPGNPFGEGGGFSNQEQAFIETTRPVLKRAYLDRILRNHREIFNSGTATAVGVAEARFGSTTKLRFMESCRLMSGSKHQHYHRPLV